MASCGEAKKNSTIYVLRRHAIGCDATNKLIALSVHSNNSITETLTTYHYKTNVAHTDSQFKQQTLSGILRTQPLVDD
ncbi:MAG: hypothetical protein ACI8QQ_002577 [Psychroserpens sp.]